MKNVYLLERTDTDTFITIGIYSHKKKAEDVISSLPQEYSYILSRLPLNEIVSNDKIEDNLGMFDHWHYGKFRGETIIIDEDGEIVEEIDTIND
ncbi:hypothetical protein ACFL54_04180 [Planctomycetota bacterium]